MLVTDQQRQRLDHALRLSKDALNGRNNQAARESAFVAVQVLVHIINLLHNKDDNILADINEELITHGLMMLPLRPDA